MKRYFIHLSYDGTNYHGWQIQPNGKTVEGEIERCLSTVLRTEIDIIGAGRTDTGVHARHMTAHFDDPTDAVTSYGGTSQLEYRLRRILPSDIGIYCIKEVDNELHARFSAKWRTYHYYVSKRKEPFSRFYSWQTSFNLDFALMNEAAKILLTYNDFACFCKSHTDVKTTLCNIIEAEWIPVPCKDNIAIPIDNKEPTEWYFRIKANRFLRNMVRAIVGTLVEVGRHKMSIDDFRKVIEGKKRTQAGESMPGNALFLEQIDY